MDSTTKAETAASAADPANLKAIGKVTRSKADIQSEITSRNTTQCRTDWWTDDDEPSAKSLQTGARWKHRLMTEGGDANGVRAQRRLDCMTTIIRKRYEACVKQGYDHQRDKSTTAKRQIAATALEDIMVELGEAWKIARKETPRGNGTPIDVKSKLFLCCYSRWKDVRNKAIHERGTSTPSAGKSNRASKSQASTEAATDSTTPEPLGLGHNMDSDYTRQADKPIPPSKIAFVFRRHGEAAATYGIRELCPQGAEPDLNNIDENLFSRMLKDDKGIRLDRTRDELQLMTSKTHAWASISAQRFEGFRTLATDATHLCFCPIDFVVSRSSVSYTQKRGLDDVEDVEPSSRPAKQRRQLFHKEGNNGGKKWQPEEEEMDDEESPILDEVSDADDDDFGADLFHAEPTEPESDLRHYHRIGDGRRDDAEASGMKAEKEEEPEDDA